MDSFNDNKNECLISTVNTMRLDGSFMKITKYTRNFAAIDIRQSEIFWIWGVEQ